MSNLSLVQQMTPAPSDERNWMYYSNDPEAVCTRLTDNLEFGIRMKDAQVFSAFYLEDTLYSIGYHQMTEGEEARIPNRVLFLDTDLGVIADYGSHAAILGNKIDMIGKIREFLESAKALLQFMPKTRLSAKVIEVIEELHKDPNQLITERKLR